MLVVQWLLRATGASSTNQAVVSSPSRNKSIFLTKPVPEPDFKRKTLADRAVEPYSSKLAAPQTTRSANNGVKNAAENGSRGFSSSLSRSTSTKAPKHKPFTSGSSSVGHGSRTTGASATRPKSSYGTHGRSRSQYQRPATSMAQRESEDRSESSGGHLFPISTNSQENIGMLHVQKKPLRAAENRSISFNVPKKRPPLPVQRSVSSPLSLRPQKYVSVDPANTDCDDVTKGFEALTLGASADRACTSRMGHGTTDGKNLDISFPSHIPVQTPTRIMPPPSRPVQKSPRRPRTPITPFINKYTNDRAPVFDDTRVASLETQFAEWKERMEKQMEKDMDKQSKVQESMDLYKQKSTYRYDPCYIRWESFPI